jgi:isoleucyl-tRNA synthetase
LCAVDLSRLYIDITKDRRECDAPASPRRRATQTVMHEAFDTLVRLIAPILVFTAEEAWRYFGRATSVHLEKFPEFDSSRLDSNALEDVEALLSARAIVAQAIEVARQQKLIGNALEAHVELSLPRGNRVHQVSPTDVTEFLILSHLDLMATEGESNAVVTRTAHLRCDRCWRHLPTVGVQTDHPTLCDRCVRVVSESSIGK